MYSRCFTLAGRDDRAINFEACIDAGIAARLRGVNILNEPLSSSGETCQIQCCIRDVGVSALLSSEAAPRRAKTIVRIVEANARIAERELGSDERGSRGFSNQTIY